MGTLFISLAVCAVWVHFLQSFCSFYIKQTYSQQLVLKFLRLPVTISNNGMSAQTKYNSIRMFTPKQNVYKS